MTSRREMRAALVGALLLTMTGAAVQLAAQGGDKFIGAAGVGADRRRRSRDRQGLRHGHAVGPAR